MHLKVLLTAGAATASLLAGTAGTVLLGHAAPTPQQKVTQPAPHHLSATRNTTGTKGRKGKKGTVTHKHGTATKGRLKGTAKHHPKPKLRSTSAPTATAKPVPAPAPPPAAPHA
jgi:hypothetical protein